MYIPALKASMSLLRRLYLGWRRSKYQVRESMKSDRMTSSSSRVVII